MKFSEAVEMNKEAFEAINEQEREELEARRAVQQEEAEAHEAADELLFEAIRKAKEKHKQEAIHSADPDVFVRVVGNQASAVRVDVKPIIDDETPSISLDFLVGALCALSILGLMAYVLAKVMGVI